MQLPAAAEILPPVERRGTRFVPRNGFSASTLSLRISPDRGFIVAIWIDLWCRSPLPLHNEEPKLQNFEQSVLQNGEGLHL